MPKIRTQTPSEIELVILDKSRRRCALCFHLSGDLHEQHGQIAHLDQNPANYAEDNLAFLCLPHHSVYDSKTSQHKNYTLAEVKAARDRLYTAIDEGRHALNAPVDPYHNQKTIVKDLHPALIGTIEADDFWRDERQCNLHREYGYKEYRQSNNR